PPLIGTMTASDDGILAFCPAIPHFPVMRSVLSSQMLITMSALLSSLALTAFPQENPLGEFAGHTDVGSPKLSGSAGYDAARQEYTLAGAGSNMWFGRDEFQFVWKKMKGD